MYKLQEELYIDECIHSGVLEDTIIEVTVKEENGVESKLRLRKVVFYDRKLKREFEFLTNLFEMRADLIAAIYKIRWHLERAFKSMKSDGFDIENTHLQDVLEVLHYLY